MGAAGNSQDSVVVDACNFDEVYPAEAREAYWRKVERVLREGFQEPDAVCKDLVRRLRENRENIEGHDVPVRERMWIYHNEPVNVAEDLLRLRFSGGEADWQHLVNRARDWYSREYCSA
jgi:hypothetical protein